MATFRLIIGVVVTQITLQSRVEYMMGETSRDFVESVTHLVAGEGGSKKYCVAATIKRKIMLPEWIDLVWEECRFK